MIGQNRPGAARCSPKSLHFNRTKPARNLLWRCSFWLSRRWLSRRLPGRPASACGLTATATVAITSARSPNGSKSIRKNCASWDRKAYFRARSSQHRAQKRLVLACRVLYRSGAPEEIRTPDPQIRSLKISLRCISQLHAGQLRQYK
jgi:hypothetical protein